MIEQGGGCIVNVTLTEGLRSASTSPGYGAAKAGVMNLTMSLAMEWAKYDVRVNAVVPSFIEVEGFCLPLKKTQT